MRFLHSMVRVYDLDAALHFFCDLLGLREVRRRDSERGRFTLVFWRRAQTTTLLNRLTYNWDEPDPSGGQ